MGYPSSAPRRFFELTALSAGRRRILAQWKRRIIFPNSDFRSALTEHEWNWNQLLIWIVATVMVIDYCRGYMNAWMDGPCSIFSCSNLMQAKESEQFQYFAIKWNSGLQSNLFNSCRVPKKMVVDLDYCVCSTSSVILIISTWYRYVSSKL